MTTFPTFHEAKEYFTSIFEASEACIPEEYNLDAIAEEATSINPETGAYELKADFDGEKAGSDAFWKLAQKHEKPSTEWEKFTELDFASPEAEKPYEAHDFGGGFSGRVYRNCTFTGTLFGSADFEGAIFIDCTFTDCRSENADFTSTFVKCSLQDCRFVNSHADEATFIGCVIDNCWTDAYEEVPLEA